MKGLIKNELLTMRRVIKLYAAVLLLYTVLGVCGVQMAGVQVFAIFFCTMLVISSISYEEKSGWEVYVNTLPVSRGQIVISKYVFMLICMAASFAFALGIQLVLNLKDGSPLFQEAWVGGAATIIACLFLAIALPILFKMGAERGRIAILMLYLIPFAIALIGERTGIRLEFSLEQLISLLPAIGLGSAALLLLSCAVSIGIYKGKEF